MSLAELIGNDEIRAAVRQYEAGSPDDAVALEAVQYLPNLRTTILVDNVDHLGYSKVRLICDAFSSVMEKNTALCMAIRPEHARAIQAFRHQRAVAVYTFNRSGEILYDVAATRIRGALDYIRATADHDSPRAQIFARRAETFASAVSADSQSSALLEAWHNGDLRQMLRFLWESAASSSNAAVISSVRGLVYRQLVGLSMPQSLLQIFSATHPHTKHQTLPFVFLRLRLLAYLDNRLPGGVVEMRRICSDFGSHFGLSADTVADALASLGDRPEASGALIRIEGDDSPLSDERQVILLPAGRVFIRQIVYSCDFLSWVYDHSHSPQIPPLPYLQGRRSQEKLDKAALILQHKLLPAFRDEHPYMSAGRQIKRSELARFDSYVELFGYGSGQWFLTRLVKSLQDYANDPMRKLDTAILDAAIGRAKPMISRLDQIADSRSGADAGQAE